MKRNLKDTKVVLSEIYLVTIQVNRCKNVHEQNNHKFNIKIKEGNLVRSKLDFEKNKSYN